MAPVSITCPACGARIVGGDRFCTACGNRRPESSGAGLVAAASDGSQTAPAEIRKRAASWAVDIVVIGGMVAIMNLVHELAGVVMLSAGTALYYVLMIGGPWGGTVGHKLIGLVIVDEESLQPIGRRAAGLRLAITAVLAIPFGLGLLLNYPLLRRAPGRTVHDIGSGTIVVAS